MYVCTYVNLVLHITNTSHLRTTNNSWGPEEFPSLKAVCVAEEDFVSIPKLSSRWLRTPLLFLNPLFCLCVFFQATYLHRIHLRTQSVNTLIST